MKKKAFDLVDYMMSKKGLYEEAAGEENEPIGDGTPSDKGGNNSELEPKNKDASPKLEESAKKYSKKRNLKESKKVCKECGDSPAVVINVNDEKDVDVVPAEVDEEDVASAPETLADWFRLGEEDEYNSETEPEGLSPEEAKSDNEKTDADLAKEGGGQSPPAELKEVAKKLRKYAKFLREDADKMDEKAEEAEDKAEEEDKDDEKKEKLEEVARRLHKKAKSLREEADDAENKAEEIVSDIEKSNKAEEKAEEAEDTAEEAEKMAEKDEEEAITEWTRNVAITGRKMLKEQKMRRLAKQLKKLLEEEEVGAGTPSDEVDLDSFGSEDIEDNQRAAAAAPTTEEELPD